MTEQFAAMTDDALPRIRGWFRADAIELIAQGRQAKQRCRLNAQHDGA